MASTDASGTAAAQPINRGSRPLRPEARGYGYDKLFSAEKEAADAVVRLLTSAVHDLTPPGELAANVRGRSGYVIDDRRSSRIAFLSGRRGSGKSTVLMSLVRILDSPERCLDVELAPGVGKLRQRVVVLEPLDMEPLAEGANLLAGILKRIEVAFDNAVHGHRRPVDRARPVESVGAAVQRLRALQQDVGIAWNGNLVQRGSALDLDAYAHDVMRAEQARLGINARLSETLDDLARVLIETREYFNPIFLLPVDDFDLAPARCLELLHLLRMVSVPRLFSAICGDIDVARSVVHMNFCGEMNQISRERVGTIDPTVPSSEIAALANQLTTNALRKLLPPAQRITLEPLTVKEVLDEIKTDEHTLGALLNGIALDQTSQRAPKTLGDLLGDVGYQARFALVMYPRHATDFLHLAHTNRDASALGLVRPATEMALAEDGIIGERRMIARSASGTYQLFTSYFTVTAEMTPGREIETTRSSDCRLRLRSHRTWSVSARSSEPMGGERRRAPDPGKPIGESAGAWLIMYHDLCELDRRGQLIGPSLVPPELELMIASWPDGEIAWPHPLWPTFYEADAFVGRVADRFRGSWVRDPGAAWIDAVLGPRLHKTIGDELAGEAKEGADHIRRWIALLPVWLAPECGTSPELASELLADESLSELWYLSAPAIRRLRANNLDLLRVAALVHRLGGRPAELDDLVNDAGVALAETKLKIPPSIRRAEDLTKLRSFLERPGRRALPNANSVVTRLKVIEANEVAAASHPINAFHDGVFRPRPSDNLDTDYDESTFDLPETD